MAKGKQAALSANRRAEAAHDVIDRLTSELADAKLRAREAERRAALVEHAARRVEELETERRDDKLLADALEQLAEWKKIAKRDGERRHAALRQLARVVHDVQSASPIPMTWLDGLDFLFNRYPAIVSALFAEDDIDIQEVQRNHKSVSSTARRFTHDERRRFERVVGRRAFVDWDQDVDVADLAADLFDAKQVGFNGDEVMALWGAPDDGRVKKNAVGSGGPES